MSDAFELMKLFELDEKPYVNLECEWAVDGGSLYFVDNGVMYQEVFGKIESQKNGISLCVIDVQQFMGWQPMVLTSSMNMSFDDFDNKYSNLM